MAVDFKKVLEQWRLDERRMYVAIGGSRQLDFESSIFVQGYEFPIAFPTFLESSMDKLLRRWQLPDKEIICVSGDARGVDTVGQGYAASRGYDVKHFPADWETFGKKAGMVRNHRMCLYLSTKPNKAVVLFWDGESTGTQNMVRCAMEFGLPVRLYNYIEQRWIPEEQIRNV